MAQDWSLKSLIEYLQQMHTQAATTYQWMQVRPTTRSANTLLQYLAAREQRLADEMAALAPTASNKPTLPFPVRRSMPTLDQLRLPLRSAAVIELATGIEAWVEDVLALIGPIQGCGFQPSAQETAVLTIHRRELFTMGALAQRLYESDDAQQASSKSDGSDLH